jgi:hypothetical protein
MKNKMMLVLGASTLVLVIGLNVRHALNDYGVKDNKLHVEVLAQSGGSGGGSGSGSGSGEGGGSGSGEEGGSFDVPEGYNADCWKKPNNHNGGFAYLYCNKSGKPDECLLSKFVKKKGGVVIETAWDTSIPTGVGWESTSQTKLGVKELCEKTEAVGCTVYSCKET